MTNYMKSPFALPNDIKVNDMNNALAHPDTREEARLARIASRRPHALAGAMVLMLAASMAQAAAPGRIPGTFEVTEAGAATYTIPIRLPPGPNGMQPPLSIGYNTNGSSIGLLGVGWGLNLGGAVDRCQHTLAQDGVEWPAEIGPNDGYCIDGNRLRTIDVGGQPMYTTELANFTAIAAVGTQGYGPKSWEVYTKEGMKYEYGKELDSQLPDGDPNTYPNWTVVSWMLKKVSDADGNSYTINYARLNLMTDSLAVPVSVGWAPATPGGTDYQNTAEFGYESRPGGDSVEFQLNWFRVFHFERLKTITVKRAGIIVRKYTLTYVNTPLNPPNVGLSQLVRVDECEGADLGVCLAATTIAWQPGTWATWDAPYTTPFATHIQYMVSSITSSSGVTYGIDYATTAQEGAYYAKGVTTAAPLDVPPPVSILVARAQFPNGTGGSFFKTYKYTGLRVDSSRRRTAGFQQRDETDGRTGFITKHYYHQDYPRSGMERRTEVLRPDGTTLISETDNTIVGEVLSSAPYNQRYYPYVQTSNVKQYEVEGALNAQLITETETKREELNPLTGNFGKITTRVINKNAASLPANQEWKTVVTSTYDPDVPWWFAPYCMGLRLGESVETTAPGQVPITRTTTYTRDYTGCRHKTRTVAPGTKYEVAATFEYDSFGNIHSTSEVAKEPSPTDPNVYQNMPTRVTTVDWGSYGLFPMTITDAEGEVTSLDYYFGTGQLKSTTDAIGLTTTWTYDALGRMASETRPDGTKTQWSASLCSTCYSLAHKLTINHTEIGIDSQTITTSSTYLDMFDRPLVERTQRLNGEFQWNESIYNANGTLAQIAVPCKAAQGLFSSCVTAWIQNSYDSIGRLTSTTRPRSELDPTPITTQYGHEGLKATVTDALSKTQSRITDPTGLVRVTTDANGYSQTFTYNSAGGLLGVTDASGRNLLSAQYEYGAGVYQTSIGDRSRGTISQFFDGYGQLRRRVDATGLVVTSNYDRVSRMTFRDEPDLDTTWTWGTSATAHNRGLLQGITSVAPGNLTYQEVISYDSKARLSERSITLPGDATQYKYNFTYDDVKTGQVSTLTYPTSTSGYRLSLKYETTDGIVTTLRDNNAPSTVFWSLGGLNARSVPTQETLGGTIVRSSAYDAVNGLLSTLTSGTPANTAALQNLSFGYDALGNLNQRQNVNRFLTENFYYGSATDNLPRLDHTTLSVNNQAASTNFDADYDPLGNFQQKSDNSGTDVPVDHTVVWTSFNVPSSITASGISESATFDYGPDHERWRMTFTKAGQSETTNYIGEVTEKVTVGAVTEYRQYIAVGGKTIAISSRKTSGANAVVYLLGDHQVSVETIANSSGISIVDESFTPYGTRRDATDWSGSPDPAARATMDGITRSGYTSHTVLGSMGLNHMRGRVQDAIAGVFLSPDPLVSDPQYSQNFNRYAYVSNNPGTFTDPTGFTTDGGIPWMPTHESRDLPCPGADTGPYGLGIGWSREERDLWGTLYNGTVLSIPAPDIDECMSWDIQISVNTPPKLPPVQMNLPRLQPRALAAPLSCDDVNDPDYPRPTEKDFGYDRGGDQEFGTGLKHFSDSGAKEWTFWWLGAWTPDSADALHTHAVREELWLYGTSNSRGDAGRSDEGNAFKHGVWNFLMGQRYGADLAEQFSMAHEREVPQNIEDGELLQDLFNNRYMARLGAQNPHATRVEANLIVLNRIRMSCLRTSPF